MTSTVTHAAVDAKPAPPFRSAHLVGIGGSGMKSLAEILHDFGVRVTGSDAGGDQSFDSRLAALGIEVAAGHRPEFVPKDAEALIYSPAIPADNPERRRAADLNIPQFSLPECLSRLMLDRNAVCIAGTHGKSTTTAMVAWILRCAGLSPTAFIGASLRTIDRGGWAGGGEHFVVESCEYRRNFLLFQPTHAAILGVEPDHFETYPDDAALIDAFAEFAGCLKPGGTLTINGDCPRAVQAAESAGAVFETCGTGKTDWRICRTQKSAVGHSFRLQGADEVVAELELPLFGRHNISNAVAAAVVCLRMGVSPTIIGEALREFPGIHRRFEILGDFNGVTFIDDYAHHPTAVRATLETAKSIYPGRRLWCVFQPHQTARVRRLLGEFSAALSIAHSVRITPAFSARESDEESARLCSHELAAATAATGVDCRFLSSLDGILPCLDDEARPGDVVVLMGAGDIERIRHELARRISRDHSRQ